MVLFCVYALGGECLCGELSAVCDLGSAFRLPGCGPGQSLRPVRLRLRNPWGETPVCLTVSPTDVRHQDMQKCPLSVSVIIISGSLALFKLQSLCLKYTKCVCVAVKQQWLVSGAWKENSHGCLHMCTCVFFSLSILCHFCFRNQANRLQMLNSHYLHTIDTHRKQKKKSICSLKAQIVISLHEVKKNKITMRLVKKKNKCTSFRFLSSILAEIVKLKLIHYLKKPFQHSVPAKSKTLSHKWWSRECKNVKFLPSTDHPEWINGLEVADDHAFPKTVIHYSVLCRVVLYQSIEMCLC